MFWTGCRVYSRKKNAGYLKAAWLFKEHLSFEDDSSRSLYVYERFFMCINYLVAFNG